MLSGQAAEKRTALVLGNAQYEPAIGALRNSDRDAKAVARTLRTLGFNVLEKHNVTRAQLLEALDAFRRTLPGAEVAIFYYAGHGISIGGSNYLIPVKSGFDPRNADETTLRMLAETRLFNAEQAVADMSSAGSPCNLIILDACRNTPLRVTRSRGLTGNGLAEMTPPAGSLIAFSTDSGRTSYDGDGDNGLYTEELLKHMRTPGLTIEQVFKRTRAGVLARSDGEQVPAEYSRLVGEDVYLAGAAVPPPAAPPESTPAAPPDPAEITRLAIAGKSTECLAGLEALAAARGPGDYALAPLEILLDRVKATLQKAAGPSSAVTTAGKTCAAIQELIPQCLPLENPATRPLAAKAFNRRGDALLLLGKPGEAVTQFDSAQSLAPDDAYILYNRGRARLALGDKEGARADFAAAADLRFNQPKARKLAQQALAALPGRE